MKIRLDALQEAIDALLANANMQRLQRASEKLTTHYRLGDSLKEEEEFLAYLTVRLPATYAALCSVLSHIPPADSLLDLGAGPGTVWWAAQSLWNNSPTIHAIEREAKFIELGKKLGAPCIWQKSDLLSLKELPPTDWAIFSYSLGELSEEDLPPLLEKAWASARKGVVVVEPGTPRGYHRVLLARDLCIQNGGSVLAPCPHARTCPLSPTDWCHFSIRLERSHLHRRAKLATLPYEDEKFSYAILTKEENVANPSRILRTPLQRGGHVLLSLCTESGLQEVTVTRKDKERYKKARKASWGDPW